MALMIPDETLREMKMDEAAARVEIACRLYSADRLSKSAAARLAGLSRAEFEDELIRRDLPWIRLDMDAAYQKEFGRADKGKETR